MQDTSTQEVPTALLGVGVRTAIYGMLLVTIAGEFLRDLRAVTTHQLLNVHRLQCTLYALFACAVTWELFLHGWHAFSDRQLICIFALLHTSSLPPFWQHGRPCTLLFRSVFPLLRDTSGTSTIAGESSQVSIPFTSPSKEGQPPDSTPEASPAALPVPDITSPALMPPPEFPSPATSSHAALRRIHRGLALWFIAIMALEVSWGVPAIMFWARRFREACVEPGTDPDADCKAYAFFLFFRVHAYGWMRWLQLAWYSMEMVKTVSLTARVCAVLGAVARMPLQDTVLPLDDLAGTDPADRASCSHGLPEAAAAAPTEAAEAAAPLLPEPAAPAAQPCAPPCGAARRWAIAQRGFAATLLGGADAAASGMLRMPRQLSPRSITLKVLLGVTVLLLTVATVECNLWWNAVAGIPSGWDFGQTLAAVAAAGGVVLMAAPGRDIMVSLVEDTFYGGEV